MSIEDATKAGAAILGLLMLYSLLKPLIAALIASQVEFTKNLTTFATTMQNLGSVISEMREDLRTHTLSDGQTNDRLLRGEACRYHPTPHPEKRP